MDEDDALTGEMRRLTGPRSADPPPLDPDTVERMLAGSVHPADAPPGYAGVVEVLAAAAAGPSPAELAGEAEAVAAFRAARRSLDPSRRKRVLGRLVSAKVLVAAAAGAVSVGTAAAAATGSLPDSARSVAHRVLHGADVPAGAHSTPGAPQPSGTALTSGAESPSSARATTTHAPSRPPDAALPGLCHAWLEAGKHRRTDRLDKAVGDRLAVAAGGAAKVTDYCAALVAAKPDKPPAPRKAPRKQSHGAPSAPPGAGGHGRGHGRHPAAEPVRLMAG